MPLRTEGGHHLLSGMQIRNRLHEMCCVTETFFGSGAGGSAAIFSAVRLLPVFGHGLEMPLLKFVFCWGRGSQPAFPLQALAGLAGAVDACWCHHKRFASTRVCAASGRCPQHGDNRTMVYFGIPCLISPWTWNPRFLHSFRSS